MPRLIVSTRPAHGGAPRYRSGLGPFGREPVMVECADWQARDLMADPALLVSQACGETEPEATESPSDADLPRKRARKAQEASK